MVAHEAWDIPVPSSYDEYSVLCKLVASPNGYEEWDTDFDTNASSQIYDGSSSDRPDIEFRVSLPCPKSKHPNIVAGQLFRVQFVAGQAEGLNQSTLVPVSDGYIDEPIGCYRAHVDPCGDDLTNGSVPQGWALADGTENSFVNGGNAVDLRGRFIVGVEDRVSPPSHSDTNYTQGNTGGTKTHSHAINGTIDGLDKDGFDDYTATYETTTDTVNHVPPWVAVYWIERLDNSETGFTRSSW